MANSDDEDTFPPQVGDVWEFRGLEFRIHAVKPDEPYRAEVININRCTTFRVGQHTDISLGREPNPVLPEWRLIDRDLRKDQHEH